MGADMPYKKKGRDMPELEIFSDFNCTWCYFDKPSIEKLEKEYEIRIRWRAFPLHPDICEGGLPIEDLFGYNFPLMDEKMNQLEMKAASLGLPLAKRTVISDSRLAQELAKWAECLGKLKEYQQATYKAYFSDGADIADPSVLIGIAKACGISKDDALSVIETRAFSHAVEKDWEKSEVLGVMVAPTYIMKGTHLMGSQPYENLEELMAANHIPRKTGNTLDRPQVIRR